MDEIERKKKTNERYDSACLFLIDTQTTSQLPRNWESSIKVGLNDG